MNPKQTEKWLKLTIENVNKLSKLWDTVICSDE